MSKIRVGLVCGAGIVSGKEVMVLELARGMMARGCDVEIATSSWGSEIFQQRATISGIRLHIMQLGFISATLTFKNIYMTLHQLAYWPVLIWRYCKFVRTLTASTIIHTNWHHLLLLLPVLRSDRDVFWMHEVMPNTLRYKLLFKLLVPRLRRLIAVSHAVARSLADVGVPSEKITIIHNGLTDPAATDDCVRHTSQGPAVGIVGQITRSKGHDDLLDAFSRVANEISAAELHIFGDGAADYEEHLKERTRDLGIAARVMWHGFVDDRAQIYRQISICVVASRSEDPLPTAAIEAAFFRVPVVATTRGGLPEIVEDGVTGLLIRARQPLELAHSLTRLLQDPKLRQEMGLRARQRALEKFTQNRFINEFMELLTPA